MIDKLYYILNLYIELFKVICLGLWALDLRRLKMYALRCKKPRSLVGVVAHSASLAAGRPACNLTLATRTRAAGHRMLSLVDRRLLPLKQPKAELPAFERLC